MVFEQRSIGIKQGGKKYRYLREEYSRQKEQQVLLREEYLASGKNYTGDVSVTEVK